MGFSAKVLADSISPCGVRLTTLEVTMPRIVLAEFNVIGICLWCLTMTN